MESFYHALFEGAVRYSICPGCMQEVPQPWSKAYKERFRSAVRKLLKERPPPIGPDDSIRD